MKRISLFLLPLLVLAALAPIAPFSISASAVSGAAFTTVNVAVDGPGHCANGNPRVNCNLYKGKEFVWLNGGPKASNLRPDGQYFFAVLAPGGQRAANDGTPKNLSDDFSAYTDRTFTVKNGKVSAYAGAHSFDAPLIRLFPYADTPNPGGVYTLAICSLAKGYPVKASACKYDQFKALAAPAPVCGPWETETANFFNPNNQLLKEGSSVLGPGTVAPHLDIEDADGDSAKLIPGGTFAAYNAGPNNTVENGGMSPAGGFGDIYRDINTPDHYTFTFLGNIKVKDFTLHMLDFGDFNPSKSAVHDATMTAFDATGAVNAMTLHYTSTGPDPINPTGSPEYGNLQITGDAMQSNGKPPGDWTWFVDIDEAKALTNPITSVELQFNEGYDPKIGFDGLTFHYCIPP